VREIGAGEATPAQWNLAIAFGVLAALVCGLGWAVLAVQTDREFGFAAVGVGYTVGWSVFIGSGQKRGRNLQWVSLASVVLGLIVGKYFAFAHVVVTRVEAAHGLSLFDPQLIRFFVAVLRDVLSPFDFLWVLLAFRGAWKIPEAKPVLTG
jgi:hypothetical protein